MGTCTKLIKISKTVDTAAVQRASILPRRYTVMSGTPHKMLEHLLDTRLVGHVGNDPFLDDFLLTHIVFMPVPMLIAKLANLYPFYHIT